MLIRHLRAMVIVALLVGGCASDPGASAEVEQGFVEQVTQEAADAETTVAIDGGEVSSPAASEEGIELGDDGTVTEEQVIAAELSGYRDDVAVRVLESPPLGEDGSSILVAEVFGFLGSYGDSVVRVPELHVAASPGVSFTLVPDECVVAGDAATCESAEALRITSESPRETGKLILEFEYSVSAEAELPVVFELTASSDKNPVSNDPDPTNNTQTIEIGQG